MQLAVGAGVGLPGLLTALVMVLHARALRFVAHCSVQGALHAHLRV